MADSLVRLSDRIIGQVRLAFPGIDLGVTEALVDHLERLPEADAKALEAGVAGPSEGAPFSSS